MSRILVLADSGFGKSTSLGEIEGLNIKGLVPEKTLIISCSKKGLPFPGWRNKYTDLRTDPKVGNYITTIEPDVIIKTIDYFLKNRPEITNYVIDDFNFVMQDFYMKNAKKKGYDNFQTIGYDMGRLFEKFDEIHEAGKNIIVLGHFDVTEVGGVIRFKLKTVGNMVDQYITPEGKFEIVLMGHEEYDMDKQQVKKSFVTGYNGVVRGKAPYGMFEKLYIPNDMGYVLEKAREYEFKK